MATGRQCLRAKAHALPRGHNGRQHKCYDIFVFFGFKGKHFHSPSQQVAQNIFAVRVARVIVSKKTSLLFSNTSPLSAKTPLLFFQLATHRPRPHSRPTSSLEGAPSPRTHIRVHAHITEFRTFCLHPSPLPASHYLSIIYNTKEGEHKATKAFTPSAPNDKWCAGSWQRVNIG